MRFSAFMGCSLDGFIARPDGALDWLDRVQQPGEDYGYAEFFSTVDTLVVGRSTYEVVLGFERWPWEGKRVVVLTHRPLTARHGERFMQGSPTEVAEALTREGAQHAYVDGGQVVSAFLAAGLLDALTVSIVPVLLGAGRPLFSLPARDVPLTLRAHRAYASGLVRLEYARS
jgi:dihydrofolate reductase